MDLFNASMSLGEKFVNSLGITILGMIIVFAVLVIIAFALGLLRVFFGEDSKKKILKDEEELKEVNITPSPVEVNEGVEDLDLIILLTAAIAAQSNKSAEDIIVRSIKPVLQRNSVWATAGRQEQMLDRI